MNFTAAQVALLAGAGAIGALCRWQMVYWSERWGAASWTATIAVNVLGCFVFGVLASWIERQHPATAVTLRMTLLTGFLGAFTTFSTFAYDVVGLLQAGSRVAAAANILLSVGLGVAAVAGGAAIARQLP